MTDKPSDLTSSPVTTPAFTQTNIGPSPQLSEVEASTDSASSVLGTLPEAQAAATRPKVAEEHDVVTVDVTKPGKMNKRAFKIKMFILKFRKLRDSSWVSQESRTDYENYHKYQTVEHHMQRSKDQVSIHQAYQGKKDQPMKEGGKALGGIGPDPKRATELVSVNPELFLDPDEMPKLDHTAVAKAAVKGDSHEKVPPTKIGGVGKLEVGEMVAYSKKGDEMVEGQVTPTSYILGKPSDKDHLCNAYVVTINGEKRAVIRTGVINTKQKAEEFEAILRQIHAKYDDKAELRVVSHQLNSFNERGMIKKQHYWMASINKKLKSEGIAQVVHINTPSNAWYYFEKALGGVNFLGEGQSRQQNLDSWGTFVDWLKSDLDGLKLPSDVRGQLDSIQQFEDCNVHVLSKNQSQLERARETNKARLVEAYHNLDVAEKRLKEQITKSDPSIDRNACQNALRKISLMKMVLGSQLEIPGAQMDRGKEGMAMLMLNEELGITGAMNCKSGLDRTGIWGSVKLGMEEMRKNPKFGPEREMIMIRDWELTTSVLNRLVGKYGEDFELVGDLNFMFAQLEPPLPRLTPQELLVLKAKIQDVVEFRKLVLNSLIEIGIPITQRSTGMAGFKWNKGLQENLIPLNFLPSIVKAGDKEIPLVKYHKDTGLPHGITSYGRRLLTKFSSSRGT